MFFIYSVVRCTYRVPFGFIDGGKKSIGIREYAMHPSQV